MEGGCKGRRHGGRGGVLSVHACVRASLLREGERERMEKERRKKERRKRRKRKKGKNMENFPNLKISEK
jgi:hypothetical protein